MTAVSYTGVLQICGCAVLAAVCLLVLRGLDKTGMSLRDQRDGQDVLYKLSRVGKFEMPAMELPEQTVEEAPAETPEPTAEPAPEPTAEPTAENVFEPITTPEPETDEVAELLVTEDADEAAE